MNISELIKNHKEKSQELIKAIELEDIVEIERLDKVLAADFDSILNSNTTSSDALIEKVEYLLDQLLSDDQKTPLSKSVIDQITKDISLFTR